MKQPSLRFRLLALATVSVVLALVIAGSGIVLLFKANLERAILADLAAGVSRLVAQIDPEGPIVTAPEPLADPRYQVPFSGAYWLVRRLDTGEQVSSRSLWDFNLKVPEPAAGSEPSIVTVAGPQGQNLAALSRRIAFNSPAGQRFFQVTLAEDRQALDEAIRRFGSGMSGALVLLGLIILGAAWLQVHLGLRPITDLRRGIEAIRQGAREQLSDAYPRELQPLVSEMNDLLAVREKSVEFARTRASDLAHSLKTPLSVLATTADKLREKGDAENAAVLDELSSEMADRVDYQMRLARLRVRAGSQLLRSSLNTALGRSISALQKTHEGEALHWELNLGPELSVNMDPHDLIELVGVLLENAAKWGRSGVWVSMKRVEQCAEVTIEDDGPGLTEEQVQRLGIRGRRLDETRKGTGLGLAIALEILALNEGSVKFGRSVHGGLSALIRIPIAEH